MNVLILFTLTYPGYQKRNQMKKCLKQIIFKSAVRKQLPPARVGGLTPFLFVYSAGAESAVLSTLKTKYF